MKVVPQAEGCREIEVGGTTYRRSKGGLFDMPEAAAKYTIKYGGGQNVALSGISRRKDGYVCQSCGFGSWFTTCSRCGGVCEREVA